MLALSVCSSIYISLCLFVWIRGLIFFFYEKDLIRIKLASAIPVKPHSFIHSSLRISLVENEIPETQEKKKKKNQEESQMSEEEEKETENYQMFGN